jgi:hypothetical protein
MQENLQPPFRRRKRLEILLLIISGLLLLSPARIWSLPLNIGTVVTNQHYDARHVVIDIDSGSITLRTGHDDSVNIKVTRHGFGVTGRIGRIIAEWLTMPAITTRGDTVRIAESSSPGVNLPLVGRVPFRDYLITVPKDGDVQLLGSATVDDRR